MIERGRRAQSRLRVWLSCRLITRGFDAKAVLADLSRVGAKIQTNRSEGLYGEAVLQWAGMEAFGTIIWARGGFCGLQFDKPVPENWLILSRQINETSACPDESTAARELARAWVSGQRRV